MDPSTLSTPTLLTTHINLHITPNFTTRTIHAVATLHIQSTAHIQSVDLDVRELYIHSVEGCKWDVVERGAFGAKLRIQKPMRADEKGTVRIEYETTAKGTAVQWLEPQQTKGGKHPYMFTQCQAIHARSLVPCQDTPRVKATYDATVVVDKGLTALMSAIRKGTPTHDDKTSTYRFEQTMPIPSYLLALAIGNLVEKEVGPRSSVWSEPEMIEECAYEFAETEKFIATAEKLLTPYAWKRYDMLILPPSFPFGGMENPCLTFLTPTLLAKDRSLVDVVAHEISHSWTGNLVSCQSWESFWLNEGWTMYLERLILSEIHGEDDRMFSATLGWKALEESIEEYGPMHPLTQLQVDLKGVDPDDAFSSIPYEKGFNLLYYLEQQFSRPAFLAFFKAYIIKFANCSITTDDFRNFLRTFMQEHYPEKVKIWDAIDWNTWLYVPGFPPVGSKGKSPFQSSQIEQVERLAKEWQPVLQSEEQISPSIDLKTFTVGQKVMFLEKLSYHCPIRFSVLQRLDEMHEFSKTYNCEIRFRWLMLGLACTWSGVYDDTVRMLGEQGRMKYTRPLYRSLARCDPELAKKTFEQYKARYHPICANQVTKDLQHIK